MTLVERLREYNKDYIEKAMTHWDGWRAYIAKGGRGSMPRDGFESYVYGWQEDALEAADALEALRAELTEQKAITIRIHNERAATLIKERELEAENERLRAALEKIRPDCCDSPCKRQASEQDDICDRTIAIDSALTGEKDK